VLRNPYSEVRGVNSSCFSTRAASRRIGFFDRDDFKRILGNMFPSGFRSDLPPPNVWLPPRTHPVFDQLRNAFLIEPMSSSERGGRRGAEGRPRTEGIRPREDSNPGHYASVMTIYTSVSPVHVHQSLRSCCCEGFGFGLVFVLPMKIEIRLLIGRDFFADWLSSLSTFSRTEKSSPRGLSAAARLFDYKTTMRRGSGSSHSAHIHFHPRTR